MKYLAIDYGEKRVGLAGSEAGVFVSPLEIVRIIDRHLRQKQILDAINKYQPSELIVGLPVNEDGSLGVQAEVVQDFIKELTPKIPNIKINFINEYLTSNEAQRRSLRDPSEPVDDQAAAVILEDFLAQKK